MNSRYGEGSHMKNVLYDLMDWSKIEAVVYSEEDNPHELLGPHMTQKGLLLQAYFPGAESTEVKLLESGRIYPMELQDETGFFAVLLPKSTKKQYIYRVSWKDGKIEEFMDPYAFGPQMKKSRLKKYQCGIHYGIFNEMGANVVTINGVSGVLFCVWAPNAVRVSVVGDFNNWDGRRHPMRRLWDFGVFELFLPGMEAGTLYKYELKLKGNMLSLKADPYAKEVQMEHGISSVVADLGHYAWSDEEWMKDRHNNNSKSQPILIYELHLETIRKPSQDGYYNYQELAPFVAGYVKKMGYTHIELLPVMGYLDDCPMGFRTAAYYAPTSRFGRSEDFQYFINYMHNERIGVILEWVPMGFPRNVSGLSEFDGTCLYEHKDMRQGYHPVYDLKIYNYARPEVKNFLIANALFWVEMYHIDGIKTHKADAALYLDYNKKAGEWVPNMYGGNENLDGIEFFKHLNSIMKKKHKDVLLIAEEDSGWPKVTAPVEKDGLGFDLKFHNGWLEDILPYMECEPLFRSEKYAELSMSMVYAYSEDFLLAFSNREFLNGKPSIINRMPGERQSMFANLRALYGYMMCYPGKKLLFMGQDFGQFSQWTGKEQIEWNLLQYGEHQRMQKYIADLNQLCRMNPAMYQLDYNPDGFEWVNCISADDNILIFLRKTENKIDTLLIVCNFSSELREDYKIGVPYPGKYKEIFNSEDESYGGCGITNVRVKRSRTGECDGRKDSIKIKLAPLSVGVFQYIPIEEKALDKKTEKSVTSRRGRPSLIKKKIEQQIREAEQIGDVEKQRIAAQEVAEVEKKSGNNSSILL